MITNGAEGFKKQHKTRFEAEFQKGAQHENKRTFKSRKLENTGTFNELIQGMFTEGIKSAEKISDIVRTGLEAGGGELKNAYSIDGLEFDNVDWFFEQQNAEEKRLVAKLKRTHKEAGATYALFAWGIFNNLRLSKTGPKASEVRKADGCTNVRNASERRIWSSLKRSEKRAWMKRRASAQCQ